MLFASVVFGLAIATGTATAVYVQFAAEERLAQQTAAASLPAIAHSQQNQTPSDRVESSTKGWNVFSKWAEEYNAEQEKKKRLAAEQAQREAQVKTAAFLIDMFLGGDDDSAGTSWNDYERKSDYLREGIQYRVEQREQYEAQAERDRQAAW